MPPARSTCWPARWASPWSARASRCATRPACRAATACGSPWKKGGCAWCGAPGDALDGLAGAIHLAAGQQVLADPEGRLAPPQAVPAEGIAAWRDSRVSFVDTPLAQALAELERYGSTGLTVRDPVVAAMRLSGTFDPRDVPTLRRVLPGALPVRLRQAGGTTEVLRAPANAVGR